MHEIDFLTLMALAKHDPKRAVFLHVRGSGEWLLHAHCVMRYEDQVRMHSTWHVFVPVGAQAQLHNTACGHCGLSVETTDLKPI